MKAIIITLTFFVVLFIGMIGYVMGVSKSTLQEAEKIGSNFPEMDYVHAPPDTITKQETDHRGLTSVMFTEDGEEWALDYLTKREYDSLFHNYVNYKQ